MAKSIHKVTEGETLYTIGKKYGVPPYIIGRENGVKEIKAGMRLIIPSPSGIKYIVKPLETIESIAEEFGYDSSLIKECNSIDKVFFGQIIYLPYKENSGDSEDGHNNI